MSNILESKNVFELAARRAAWDAKIAEHPDYGVAMLCNDGDVVIYEGRLWRRMTGISMTPAIKNSGA